MKALFLLALAATGFSASPAPAADPPERTISVTVFGADACPRGKDDEIVVCARLPESERYRLPKRFRGQKAAQSGAGNSWTNKVSTLETASRIAGGTPNTCSPVGSGGMTGCFTQLLRRWRAERAETKSDAQRVP